MRSRCEHVTEDVAAATASGKVLLTGAGEPQSISLEELKQLPLPQLTHLWKEYVDELRAGLGRAAGDEASPAGRRVVALVEELRTVLTCLMAACPLGTQSLRQAPTASCPCSPQPLQDYISAPIAATYGGSFCRQAGMWWHLPSCYHRGMRLLRHPLVALCPGCSLS